ncbi:helix-turn-helix domain-containing protein [Solilutibacter silvestris]|uniref:helix-turn-helix domain-containing protein n=1 Tax=Solilutibacter silvestris TaxID=1645665 RepID=UPI000CA028B9|nr:helix-turn-helix transcriptional regulator [Lysobacter silvestris]
MGTDTLQSRIGVAIRARREAMGISQEDFADHIEMHRAYYGTIERGRRNLTLVTLEKIAVGLGIPPSRLLKEAGS